jgi:glycosyltransferase involved in cell wall biosynthesis
VPFARVLARSFAEHHPDGRFWVFLTDEWHGYIDPAAERFEILDPDTVRIPEFEAMAKRYDVLELATAVKPWILRHLLQLEGAGATLFLDPDIKIYGSLSELERLAVSHGIVLIPHFTEPIPRDGRRPSELDILVAGVYNLGFIGMGRSDRSDELLDWWAERLETECRVDPSRGFFVDQRWMDLVPGMLDVAIVRDPGYDVAYWNLHYREITSSGDQYLVNGSPLRFFHFSGYDPSAPGRLSKHQNRIQLARWPAIRRLCDEYGRELIGAGYEEVRTWPYQPRGGVGEVPRRAPRTPEVDIPSDTRQRPRRRSLGRRIVDLENLINGLRRSGTPPLTIARGVLAATNPLRDTRVPALVVRRRNGVPTASATRWGVNVVGYLNAELGVGEAARQTIAALESCEIPVQAVTEVAPESRSRHRHRSVTPDEARHPINLLCVNADMLPSVRGALGDGFFRDRFSIGFWHWEVAAFPDRWLPSFGLVDEVWVCSRHTADALEGQSSTPVTRVTLPVAPEPPADSGAATLGQSGDTDFTFLFMFDHHSVFERKNPLGLIDAFIEAFPRGSGASLVLKCINADRHPADHDILVADASRHPGIHVHEGYLGPREKNALLASCDCYVSLHRAEGFGLTLAEAMYFGRPVIGTGYSGNLEFMTPENSFLVDYELIPIGIGADPYPAQGEWAEPDLEHAARTMREVFEDRARSRAIGVRGALDIRRTHSRQAAGSAMRRRLEAIRQAPSPVQDI